MTTKGTQLRHRWFVANSRHGQEESSTAPQDSRFASLTELWSPGEGLSKSAAGGPWSGAVAAGKAGSGGSQGPSWADRSRFHFAAVDRRGCILQMPWIRQIAISMDVVIGQW